MAEKPNQPVTIIAPYYKAASAARQSELDRCLRENVANPHVSTVILLIDDGHVPPIDDDKIINRAVDGRPTYLQWVELCRQITTGYVVLANSDIYFDDSLALLADAMAEPQTFMALTRWEVIGQSIEEHPNPQWSQDAWAVSAESNFSPDLLSRLDFGLGVPRCDNKVAYVFATSGWKLVNPCHHVKSFHVHETGQRSYDKRSDDSIVGGVAYVYPGSTVNDPARIHFDIWSKRTHDVVEVSVNNNLEHWRKEDEIARGQLPAESLTINRELSDKLLVMKRGKLKLSIAGDFSVFEDGMAHLLVKGTDPTRWSLIYKEVTPVLGAEHVLPRLVGPYLGDLAGNISDRPKSKTDLDFWQFPCLTEKQAYENHRRIKPFRNFDAAKNILQIYIPLPWATYIDKKEFPESTLNRLKRKLASIRELAHAFDTELRVHTVCQHIHWRRTVDAMLELGVTDLSISHCEDSALTEGVSRGLRIHPWTLFAVNYATPERSNGLTMKPMSERPLVASFIGAHMGHYRSDIRVKICEGLAALDRDDLVIELSGLWHFNKIVYNQQVENKTLTTMDVQDEQDATVRYNQILSDSRLALCPDGAGPNTLRFWEAIAIGCVPVLFDRALHFPGACDAELQRLCLFWEKDDFGPAFYDWLTSFSIAELEDRSQELARLYKRVEPLTAF